MSKRKYHQMKGDQHQKKSKTASDGSENEVLFMDVQNLLSKLQTSFSSKNGSLTFEKDVIQPAVSLPPRFSEIEVEISLLSSTGDGLGYTKAQDHVYVVPFTVPGDVVLAKTVNQYTKHTITDFIRIIKPGHDRDDSLPKCPYFSKCAGCQLQMLPYSSQLKHKKAIVEKAYQNFSTLAPHLVPPVAETIGSPLQYGYRTKLTPHFDGPPGAMSRAWRKDPSKRHALTEVPAIGFQEKGRGKTIDIEDCPIGTDAVRQGMKRERARIARDYRNYSKGATVLLRESTSRSTESNVEASKNGATDTEVMDISKIAVEPRLRQDDDKDVAADDQTAPKLSLETKTCITDSKSESTEFIESYVFKNAAGAFFQNNNSILPPFTQYIRDRVIQSDLTQSPVKFLIDAYCGSGLFTVTLSTLFTSSLGIDISEQSIKAAEQNATLNKIENARFITADAAQLFKEVGFPSDQTAVVIDPPRKGCDNNFLEQLLGFGPQRVVYVSCNVHTQARDVGVLVEGFGNINYKIESLQGFDFFPQTGHVESVAILTRSEKSKQDDEVAKE